KGETQGFHPIQGLPGAAVAVPMSPALASGAPWATSKLGASSRFAEAVETATPRHNNAIGITRCDLACMTIPPEKDEIRSEGTADTFAGRDESANQLGEKSVICGAGPVDSWISTQVGSDLRMRTSSPRVLRISCNAANASRPMATASWHT